MTDNILNPDLCIIGAGSGGLSVAAGAAQMGADVVLIEGHKMGGDCLNVGCVPSKSLLAAAHKAALIREGAGVLGVSSKGVKVNMPDVHSHVQDVIAQIRPHDSVERFEGLGVKVISDYARFTSPVEVQTGNTRIQARYFVIASGSVPVVPDIQGLDRVDYLTNENIFDLTQLPKHLIILGSGPVGCEMGQAFRQLGAQVTILSHSALLPHDDDDLKDILKQKFKADGIVLHENAHIQEVNKNKQAIIVKIKTSGNQTLEIEGSHLLVAAGHKAATEKLNLDEAKVEVDQRGIIVDKAMRTSNKKIFAIGDVTNTYRFTHIAGYQAGIVIQRALFKMPAKANYNAVPWVTYTNPEIANVGMNEKTALEKMGEKNFQVLKWPYLENDRAKAERETEGFVKVIIKPNGKILGAAIAGKQAGDLLQPWSLAISKGLKIKDMAQIIVPYPTLGEINKRAAGSYFTPRIFSPKVKKIVALMRKIDEFLAS